MLPSSATRPIISSIKDCIDIIKNLQGAIEHPREIFYRGHGQENWDLEPSLFRKNINSSHEKYSLQKITSSKSLAFAKDKSMFEHLVRAQHYGLPTRLLDITLNPLIALFFACSSEQNKNGELISICYEQSRIKYHDSHTVSCLAHLANLSDTEKQIIRQINTIFNKELNNGRTFKQSIQKFENNIEQLSPNELNPKKIKSIRELHIDLMKEYHFFLNLLLNSETNGYPTPSSRLQLVQKILDVTQHLDNPPEDIQLLGYFHSKILNAPNDILQNSQSGSLLFFSIAEERPGFQNFIKLEDLFSPLLVYPKQGNERIIAQQGAFLLFGLNKKIEKNEEAAYRIFRHLIPQETKKNILEELNWLGINESFIYPELENLSARLRKKMERKV